MNPDVPSGSDVVAGRFLIVAGYADSLILFRGDLLAAMVKEGWEVHAAAPQMTRLSDTRATLERMGVLVHDIPLRRAGTNVIGDLRLVVALVRLMRRIRPDVMLGYTIKPVVYGTIAGWLARVPHRFALVTGLGYAFTNGRGGVLVCVIRRLYAFALARAGKVFFQNPDDESSLRETWVLPTSVPTVVVAGSGVNTQRFARREVPVARSRFLMIARLLGDKGVREYARAARAIRLRRPEVTFSLVGWIDETPDAISQSDLDDWIADGDIDFLGKLDDVRPAIADCTVYVLPSYREGTPRTVLEAMSIGRPIITTDAPGCRETVVEGVNGFLVPVKSVDALVDAMMKFVEAPGLAVRMGAESRRIAESKYDVHKVNAVMLREMGIRSDDSNRD